MRDWVQQTKRVQAVNLAVVKGKDKLKELLHKELLPCKVIDQASQAKECVPARPILPLSSPSCSLLATFCNSAPTTHMTLWLPALPQHNLPHGLIINV